MGSSTYWHGALLNNWANDWMKLHAEGKPNLIMSNMEDNVTPRQRLSFLVVTMQSETDLGVD
ncbi:MAG: hypothetical protein J6386_22560 [Candidatus Synoicihabitans palmerolidicus]|nr:hypothetical protein [Candidatus Synoicihabitans palmerolidicus]